MNIADPFFSIIIPTYNRASFISSTIPTVLNQTFSSFEVLIVDDGSKDNTEDVVKSINHPAIAYYKKENGERGAARNYGWERAKGEYVTFLDSDDILYPNHFEEAYKFLSSKKNIACYAQAYEKKDAKKGTMLSKAYYSKAATINDQIIKANFLSRGKNYT